MTEEESSKEVPGGGRGTAAIYMDVDEWFLSSQELDQLVAMREFARAEGWEILAAYAVQFTSEESRDRHQIYRHWRKGAFDAVIAWDSGRDAPGIWTDNVPDLLRIAEGAVPE